MVMNLSAKWEFGCVEIAHYRILFYLIHHFLFKTIYNYYNYMFFLGANVKIKNSMGCNFLHLTVLQPKGLQNLSEEILKVNAYLSLHIDSF